MLSSFKSRPSSYGLRALPHGGLGGCVELKNEPSPREHDVQQEGSRSKPRKKPISIDVKAIEMPQGRKSDAHFPATPKISTPKTPKDYRDGVPHFMSEDDLKGFTPYHMWDRCKDNPWLATKPRKETWSTGPIRRQQTLPAELPGSLLMPSQGFTQSNPPSTPPRPIQSLRSSSDATISSPPPSLTSSCQTTLGPRSEPSPVVLSSPLQKNLPKLPRKNHPRDLTTMNVEQLLKVLDTLGAWEITDQWITVVEKGLAKLRGFVFSFTTGGASNKAGLRLFCDEIQSVLRQAESMCESHSEEFREAQKSTDPVHESDQVKILRTRSKMRDIILLLPPPGWYRNITHDELEKMRLVLLHSIQVISGFVRNQMTFHLHHLCGGLPNTTVRMLRNFDRGTHPNKLDNVTEGVQESVNAFNTNKHHNGQNLQEASSKSSEMDFDDKKSGVKGRLMEPVIEISEDVGWVSKLEEVSADDIIESYLDTRSSSSESNNMVNVIPKYQGRVIELDEEVNLMRKSFMPRSKSSLVSISPPSLSPSTTPSNSPTPLSITPPPLFQNSPNREPKRLIGHYRDEVASHDSHVQALRSRISDLESQNEILSKNIEALLRQIEHGPADTSPVITATGSGGGGGVKLSKFRFLSKSVMPNI